MKPEHGNIPQRGSCYLKLLGNNNNQVMDVDVWLLLSVSNKTLYKQGLPKRFAPYIFDSLFVLYITATLVVKIPSTNNFKNTLASLRTESSSHRILNIKFTREKHYFRNLLQSFVKSG